ncbi:MAG: hypothetical protein ACSHWY_01680 [Octadecabacter sp.]
MSKGAVQKLTRLLEVEREALLDGDFAALGSLIEEKEALAGQFNETNARDLQILSTALSRNSALFAAAREGVNTVRSTLQKQRQARNTLSSYDSSGKATKISQPARMTERRY